MADQIHPMLGDPDAPAIDWSHLNQPFGSIQPTTPTPSERLGNAAVDALIGGGAQPYAANHLVDGVSSLLGMTPASVPIFAANLIDANRRNDFGAAMQAMGGIIPDGKPAAKAVLVAAKALAHEAEPILQRAVHAYGVVGLPFATAQVPIFAPRNNPVDNP